MEDQLFQERASDIGACAETPVPWHFFWRIAFRFWFLYFVGTIFPIPVPVVSWVAVQLFQAKLPLVGCLNVFGKAVAVDGACAGFLVKAGTETLPDLQAR